MNLGNKFLSLIKKAKKANLLILLFLNKNTAAWHLYYDEKNQRGKNLA